ncbi:CDP-alcohol phosphatidyltransferase family protein [Sphingomonas sp.]|uniref:CDP-alcohol phosphatidyltransferase family protein n=1 Tax=Sphingomonas sp. TaxID=28214 RepID=UPI0025CC15DE|nr:CDP-alcohol phosphatidyltransferase family protein [Sphingomonas sp.]
MREILHMGKYCAAAAQSGRAATFLPPLSPLSRSVMSSDAPLLFVPVGSNSARLFGLDAKARACRLAANAGFECADSPPGGREALLASLDYAWDPAWLTEMANRPATVLTLGGKPVLAHVPADASAAALAQALVKGDMTALAGLERVEAETVELSYRKLRKRDRPFVMPLDPADPEPVERAAYDASYKGVTDALTLYLWRRPAFYLTRWAAEAGLTPNMVTAAGFVLCVLAFWLFWEGHYWLGIAAGFVFMVLDTVDGKLARCTGTSSEWGNLFDHGIDLVHPPFWWWAWLHGLEAYGRPLEPIYETMLLWVIIGGYVAQRLIEGIFLRRHGMHIHVWRPIDSQFRLVTARRNPNMVILFAALLFGRPDIGIELVALWTLVSLIFHAVRMAQATVRAEQGREVVSWLA